MSLPTPRTFLVFDVESIGLRGEGYAVAAGIYQEAFDGLRLVNEGIPLQILIACSPSTALGSYEDRAWVRENIPALPETHACPRDLRATFWAFLTEARRRYPDILVCAEASYPVEARFLEDCIFDDRSRADQAPYPLHDISTMMLAAGLDPLATYPRLSDELPKHNPLCDVRQSARLLGDALHFRRVDFQMN